MTLGSHGAGDALLLLLSAGGVRDNLSGAGCSPTAEALFFISPTSACHPAARRVSI